MSVDNAFWFSAPAGCDYDDVTLAYAACRFIRQHYEKSNPLIRLAVRLGLSKGKEAKPIRQQIALSPKLAELPGSHMNIYLTISQGTITVNGVRLS